MDDVLFRQYKADVCKLFKRFGKSVKVYLRSAKTKDEEYDPLRDEGYSITRRNPIHIKAWVRNPSPTGKLLQAIGTVPTGTKEIIVFKKDINTLKISEKIVIDGVNYHVFNDALGNRFTVLERIYDLVRVVIFRKDGDS